MTYVVRQRGPRELRVRVVERWDGSGPTIVVEKWSAKRRGTSKKVAVVFLTSNQAERLVSALTAARVDLITARERKRHVQATA